MNEHALPSLFLRRYVAASWFVVPCAWPSVAAAEKPAAYVRDGVYLGADLGGGVAFVSSTASISNGYRQPIASSAVGGAVPAIVFDVGGTLRQAEFVVGGRIATTFVSEPEIEAQGRKFRVRDTALQYFAVMALCHYYPDLRKGPYFGGAFGLAGLDVTDDTGENQRGFGLALEAGYRAFVSPNWSVGGVLRASAAVLGGPDSVKTAFISPTLGVSLAFH